MFASTPLAFGSFGASSGLHVRDWSTDNRKNLLGNGDQLLACYAMFPSSYARFFPVHSALVLLMQLPRASQIEGVREEILALLLFSKFHDLTVSQTAAFLQTRSAS